MENDLISRSALMKLMCRQCNIEMSDQPCEPDDCFVRTIILYDTPAVDAVSRSFLEQIHWERNLAIEQLRDLDIPFGGTAPDVV